MIYTEYKAVTREGGGGGTPLYLPYGYVPRYRVCFFAFQVWGRVSLFDILSRIGYDFCLVYGYIAISNFFGRFGFSETEAVCSEIKVFPKIYHIQKILECNTAFLSEGFNVLKSF